MNKFIDWINDELKERGWSNNELARRAEISHGTLSMVINGRNSVSWELCANLARALGKAPEEVFRIAGLLPPVPDPAGVRDLTDFAKHLSAEDIEEVTAYARFRYERAKGHR